MYWEFKVNRYLRAGWSCRSCNTSCHAMRCHSILLNCLNITHPSETTPSPVKPLLLSLYVERPQKPSYYMSSVVPFNAKYLSRFGYFKRVFVFLWDSHCFVVKGYVIHLCTPFRVQQHLIQSLMTVSGLFGYCQTNLIKLNDN